ncbi:hypothetical protein CA265_12060 [Sphingobacteriaceae bacterium GW460-11-11-14-LB5]|nr:hypothetical protein CA265_12060 [Sphingobacteriaceae bacterium GW460-11-11-14-LB5]
MKLYQKILVFLLSVLSFSIAKAQQSDGMKWFNPVSSPYPVLKGKYWESKDTINFYNRLPSYAKDSVRLAVWNLAKQTAGEYIDFYTNAGKIVVRYQCGNPYLIFDGMSKISTNGLDMHVQDESGKWHFINGFHSFKDTISFTCDNIDPKVKVKRFRLYLPLHNFPKWLEIGVVKNADFKVEAASVEKPIVFYGTSIMQGGSTSRHGLTWFSILGRRIDQPMINLGFSGNGRLEKPIINLINTIDAKIFVLDCQPNLIVYSQNDENEIAKKITLAVETLHQKHPKTPILLTEHSGSLPDITLDTSLAKPYNKTSAVLSGTYQKLKKVIPNLHLLAAKEIGFTYESTGDGTHPNDIGMMQYANAYEKAIHRILGK